MSFIKYILITLVILFLSACNTSKLTTNDIIKSIKDANKNNRYSNSCIDEALLVYSTDKKEDLLNKKVPIDIAFIIHNTIVVTLENCKTRELIKQYNTKLKEENND